MEVPKSNVVPMQPQPGAPSETMLMLAAAEMHKQGRLATNKDEMPFFASSPADYSHEWNSTNAELYNWFRNTGMNKDEARQHVLDHLKKAQELKAKGEMPTYRTDIKSEDETGIAKELSKVPMY